MRTARLGMILLATGGAKSPRPHDVLPWLRSKGEVVTDWDAKRQFLEQQMRMAGVRFSTKE